MKTIVDDKTNIFLRFQDEALEREFWESYELDLRSTIRNAVGLSLTTWTMGLILTFFILPDQFVHFACILIVSVYAPGIFLILSKRTDRLLGKYHLISALTNLIFGILLIYFCSFFPYGTDMMLMLLIFTVFVGFYSYRLLLKLGIAVIGAYLLTFQVYITFLAELEPSHYQILTFVTWLTLYFAIFAGYASEKSERLIFLQRRTILRQKEQIEIEKQASDKLLRNILPEEVAHELQTFGNAKPRRFDEVTILFSDFQDFTRQVEAMSTEMLIHELNEMFSHFDDIMLEEGIEKIETIGDAYLAAAGLPEPVPDHAQRCTRAAIRMIQYLQERNARNEYTWHVRIGLHTGPVTTGVVGKSKFAYDVFGDTVNVAARMQTSSEPGKINVSASTYELIKKEFTCEHRGALHAKGKGQMEMYYVC